MLRRTGNRAHRPRRRMSRPNSCSLRSAKQGPEAASLLLDSMTLLISYRRRSPRSGANLAAICNALFAVRKQATLHAGFFPAMPRRAVARLLSERATLWRSTCCWLRPRVVMASMLTRSSPRLFLRVAIPAVGFSRARQRWFSGVATGRRAPCPLSAAA